ncbi:MAG: hypothetical protein Q4C96_00845 [Planctomycetia bacterium]|nr:hypothetical protein [Planctomycetia bacterium]
MKKAFPIFMLFLAALLYMGTAGCNSKQTDTKKTDDKAVSECGHDHGTECGHDHGKKDAAEEPKTEDSKTTELPVLTETPASGENESGNTEPTTEETLEIPAELPPAGSDVTIPEELNLDPPAPEELTIPSESTTGTTEADTKPSVYAPADITAKMLEEYMEAIEKYAAAEEEFEENLPRILRDANTLIALALVLGLHDQPNDYKASAPAIIKTAQALTKKIEASGEKTPLADVQKDVKALRASFTSTEGGDLGWDTPVASMKQMMVQVPLLDSKLKGSLRRFSRTKDVMAGQAATIAVLCQVSTANVAETEAPTEAEKWIEACIITRDDAAALYTAIANNDKDAAKTAYEKMAKSCDVCHETFHKAAIGAK